jgi:hypothetical protein
MRGLRRAHPSWRLMRLVQRATRRDVSVLLSPAPYAQHDLGRHLGLAHYDRTLARFIEDIEGFRFRGRWPGTRGFRLRPDVRYAARFERDRLLSLARDFVVELLQPAVARVGKSRWCDDTPNNLLASDFLLELFPDMKLVHIHRDPRDVLASAVRVQRLKWILEQWRAKREALPPRYAQDLSRADVERVEQELGLWMHEVGYRTAGGG